MGSCPQTVPKLKKVLSDPNFGAFGDDDLQTLVKRLLKAGYWAESAEEERAIEQGLAFAKHPAAHRFLRLKDTGCLGFARYDDAELRSLLRKLVAAGYWATDQEATLLKEL